jgi:hypothetical protein
MELLYAIGGIASPHSARSHAALMFHVPAGLERLVVKFNYSPEELTDEHQIRNLARQALVSHPEDEDIARYLNDHRIRYHNLLTLSFDDPQRHRGAAHQFDRNQSLVLSEQEASPGLLRGSIPAGMWKAVISFHAVNTDKCEFDLQIWGGAGHEQ